jgi:hypothetical protein
MTVQVRHVTLSALVASHLVLLLAGAAAIYADVVPGWCEDEFLGCFYALPFAQLSLLAVWLAWGSQRLVRRLAVAITLAVVLWLGCLILVFAVLPRYWTVWQSRAELVALGAAQWLLVQTPLWATRRCGWRVGEASFVPETGARPVPEFGVIHFVVWTVALITLHGLGRWLVLPRFAPGTPRPFWLSVPIVAGGNAALALLAVWAALLKDGRLIWQALGLLVAAVLTAGELVLFDVAGVPAVIGTFLWAANMTQIVVLLGSLAVVQLCGYRLVTGRPA